MKQPSFRPNRSQSSCLVQPKSPQAALQLLLVLSMLGGLSACLGTEDLRSMNKNSERLANEVERNHEHINGMNRNTKRLADELEADREYIQKLTLELTKMSESIQSLSKLGHDTVTVLMNKIFNAGANGTGAPAPAAETPNLDDILGAPLPTEPKPDSPAEASPLADENDIKKDEQL